jgi:hypothetical protein
VKEISLAQCRFTSAILTTFVQSVRWETAVVADLNISEAIIGDAGPTLVEAMSASSSLDFITIGKGLRLPLKDNYGSEVLDAAGKGIEAGGATVIAWWVTTDVAAALTKIDVRKNEGLDETVLAVLRAAAPARCKILADAATAKQKRGKSGKKTARSI